MGHRPQCRDFQEISVTSTPPTPAPTLAHPTPHGAGGQRKKQCHRATASATTGTHHDTPSSPQVVLTSRVGDELGQAAGPRLPTGPQRPSAPPGGLSEWRGETGPELPSPGVLLRAGVGGKESGPGRYGEWVSLLGYSELRDLKSPKGRGNECRPRTGSRISSMCSRPRKE